MLLTIVGMAMFCVGLWFFVYGIVLLLGALLGMRRR